jgi:hypothetical protein
VLDTVTDAVLVHPLLSVTVTVYVPPATLFTVVPAPLRGDAQLYVYGPVPPLAVAVTDPFEAPQFAAVDVVDGTTADGCPTVTVAVELHPLLSVVVTVYVPGLSVEGVIAEVPPAGLQAYV